MTYVLSAARSGARYGFWTLIWSLAFSAAAIPLRKCTSVETDVSLADFHAPEPEAIPSFTTLPLPVAIDEIITVPNGRGIVALTNKGVIRSIDNGQTWSAAYVTGAPARPKNIIVSPHGTLLAWSGNKFIRSDDGGANWAPLAESDQAPISNVIGATDGTLLGLGPFDVLLRSSDDGLTWSASEGDRVSVRRLCVDHFGNVIGVGPDGTIARATTRAGGWTLVENSGTKDGLYDVIATPGRSLVAVGNGIFRSIDGGVNWRRVLGAGLQFAHVRAYGNETLIAVGDAIARSDDGGATWSVVERRYTSLVSTLAEPSGALLAVSWHGMIVRSVDHGKTWGLAHAGHKKHSMPILLAAPDGALLAGGSGPVIRSVDSAANWSVSKGIDLPEWQTDAGTATKYRLNSIAGSPDGSTFVAVGANGTIVRSRDNGQTWADIGTGAFSTELSRVVPVGQREFLAVGRSGTIIRSDDLGFSWSNAVVNGIRGELSDVAAGTEGVVVAVGKSIARSADYGKRWDLAEFQAPAFELRSVVFTPTKTFVAVGRDTSKNGSLIVRSTDGGRNWALVENLPAGTGLSYLAVDTRGTIVAVGDGMIVRSTDDGRSWRLAARTSSTVLNYVLAGPERLLVAVGDQGTIVRSSDGGENWSHARGTEKIYQDLRSAIVQPSGSLIAVGSSNAVVRSNDSGASWALVPTERGNNLHQVIGTKDGTILAVGGDLPKSVLSLSLHGEAIITRGAPSRNVAPTIRRLTHAYSAEGLPVLRVWLDDPAGLCRKGECLTASARSLPDHNLGVEPRILPSRSISTREDGTYRIAVDPSLFSAARPDSMFMQIRVSGSGFSHIYPKGESYFEIPNNPYAIYTQKWFIYFAIAIGIALMLCGTLLLRPLWLLGLASRPAILDSVPKAGLPAIGNFVAAAVGTLILPALSRHPRVLNAWVEMHAGALTAGFDAAVRNVLEDCVTYSALPLDGPNNRIVPSPATLSPFFSGSRCCVQIIGQGGVGKTTLAFEIGRWLHQGDMTTYPAVAIFIDEEFSDLLQVVQDKLSAIVAEQVQPKLVSALLSSGRLWLIIDRVSERTAATRSAFKHLYRTLSPKVVIATARFEIDIDTHQQTVLLPKALDSTTLLSFLSEQLISFNSLELFPRFIDQSALVQRLAKQITVGDDELPLTPLLVRIFVMRAVQLVRQQGIDGLDRMPDSVPEAYFSYVERLDAGNATAGNGHVVAPELLRRAAALIAYVELREDFRPKQVPLVAVEEALHSDIRLGDIGLVCAKRLEENGLLVRRVYGTEVTVEYLLDPLAECLGAFEYARLCGASAERWSDLIGKVVEQGPACNGFLLALRMNHAAYRIPFQFPPVTFPNAPT